jgi:hypothetical protein
MAISELDKLEAAEYVIDLLDKAKAKPSSDTKVPNGCGVYDTEHGDWMSRARTIVRHRKSQYLDNSPKRRFGPLDPNPER